MPAGRVETLPPCYAMVLPGLEELAGEEIVQELGGEVKKLGRGFVVFRLPEITEEVLSLRTVEDVFLLAWGSDQLTHRAEDLDRIRRWTTREPDWDQLLRIHHAIRPKPKGKPTFWMVAQMEGQHGYLRRDARKALGEGLASKLPASWKIVEEDATVEVWLTIQDATAICGLRLSDRTMRHRTYKLEHRPASLRPTLAAAMVRLAEIKPQHTVLDPLCGVGTILAEHLVLRSRLRDARGLVWGGDIESQAVRSAAINLRRLGPADLLRWDSRRLPLPDALVDRVISNPPFGKQLSDPEAIGPLYRDLVREFDRVLKPGGRAVLLVSAGPMLQEAVGPVGWKSLRRVPVRVLGQKAAISVWQKPR
jgi:23S rRNA G2445 N2-methylase RlmL